MLPSTELQVHFGPPPTTLPMDTNATGLATATFNDSLLQIGWSQLWVKSLPCDARDYDSVLSAAYVAGYAEGALTHHRIDEHYYNTYRTFFDSDHEDQARNKVLTFLSRNLQWVREQVAVHTRPRAAGTLLLDVQYWHTIGTILSQFDGLVAGYQTYSNRAEPHSSLELYLLNADGDLEDLIPACNRTRTRAPGDARHPQSSSSSFAELVKSLKCSALIRILPNASEVVFGHTTWDQYSAMNRIYKHYDLPVYNGSHPHQRRVSFSSSPAYLASVDDFYLLDSGLAVIETTNGLHDDTLYQQIVPQTVLAWMRSLAANAGAQSGRQWTRVFAKHNSGTYNNQWMVLDLNRFTTGVGFASEGLMLLEQMPGMVKTADVTDLLMTAGYWASYNVPFFDSIYRATGFAAMYRTSNYSSSWSHALSPRALIFQRDAPAIASLADLKQLLRYNDWRHDPLSEGHASKAVASRYDLEPPETFSLDGGIDTKVSSYSLARTRQADAISGPTCDQNPIFTWDNTSFPHLPHRGHPQVFNFSFVRMQPIE